MAACGLRRRCLCRYKAFDRSLILRGHLSTRMARRAMWKWAALMLSALGPWLFLCTPRLATAIAPETTKAATVLTQNEVQGREPHHSQGSQNRRLKTLSQTPIPGHSCFPRFAERITTSTAYSAKDNVSEESKGKVRSQAVGEAKSA